MHAFERHLLLYNNSVSLHEVGVGGVVDPGGWLTWHIERQQDYERHLLLCKGVLDQSRLL